MRDLNDQAIGGTLTSIEFNDIPSELQNLIVASGQTLTSSDLQQLLKATGITSDNKTAALLTTVLNKVPLTVTSDDGGVFLGVTGAAISTYSNDSVLYCGAVIVPTGGDGSAAWVRVTDSLRSVKWHGATLAAAGAATKTAIDEAWAAMATGEQVYWPPHIYDLTTNGLTCPAKIIHNIGQATDRGAATRIISSDSITLTTESLSGAGLSRGTSFEGIQIINTAASGTAVEIHNGGIRFADSVIEATGTGSTGVLIQQMYGLNWERVFTSGKTISCKLNPTGANGADAVTQNTFTACSFFGQSSSATWGLEVRGGSICHSNVFIGCDNEQTIQGVYVDAVNNVFIGFNIESDTIPIQETATASSTWITPSLPASGTVTISDLSAYIAQKDARNMTSRVAGHGIQFPVTKRLNTNVNTFDDYEEGSSTVLLASSTGTITLSGSQNTISWNKVGNKVSFSGQILVSAISTPTGALIMTGLPYTPLAGTVNYTSVGIQGGGLSASVANVTASIQGALKTVYIEKFSSGITAAMAADVVVNSTFRFNGFYFTDE